MQNAKNKKNVVITTPKTLSASAKTTIAMTTDAVDFDFEIELEVLTAHHMDSRIPKPDYGNLILPNELLLYIYTLFFKTNE